MERSAAAASSMRAAKASVGSASANTPVRPGFAAASGATATPRRVLAVPASAIDGSRGSRGGSDAHPAASTTQAQASQRIAAWVAAEEGRARGTRPILPPGPAGRYGTKDPWGGGCDLGAIASGRGRSYDGFQEAATETVYIVDDDVAFARGLARVVAAAGWQTEVF